MLAIGGMAPEFALPNQNGEIVRLSDYRGKKVVIFAFPKAGTSGCTKQACAFRDALPKLQDANAVVFGVSGDTQAELRHFKESEKLTYDLLSDRSHSMLDAYGAWAIGFGMIKIPIIRRSMWVIDEQGRLIDMEIGIAPEKSMQQALETALRGAAAGS